MSGLEVLKRVDKGVTTLLVYRLDGRAPSAQACEDAGEDHGFYEPKIEDAHSFGPYQNDKIVTDGFTGQLCDHEWGLTGHYGRNPFGMFTRCKKCGAVVSTAQKRRSNHIEFMYGEWSLRKHIWDRWFQRGPVPGSLAVQEHHK